MAKGVKFEIVDYIDVYKDTYDYYGPISNFEELEDRYTFWCCGYEHTVLKEHVTKYEFYDIK